LNAYWPIVRSLFQNSDFDQVEQHRTTLDDAGFFVTRRCDFRLQKTQLSDFEGGASGRI
jgi:hypothetical protein